MRFLGRCGGAQFRRGAKRHRPLGTGRKFLNDSTQGGLGLPDIVRFDVVRTLSHRGSLSTLHCEQIILSVLATATIPRVSQYESRDICSRPCRSVFAIQISSFEIYRLRRM